LPPSYPTLLAYPTLRHLRNVMFCGISASPAGKMRFRVGKLLANAL
jgi:hypothetical protein